MGKIHQLPQHIISQIAAGEVIERPVYAVKELIENAIDANADNIIIHLEESGLNKITIIDNGEGMAEEDLQECFKPHTTSKINSEDQLQSITTLGFRGEALSSIAAISNMEIHSRPTNTIEGKSITIRNGQIEKLTYIGMPPGTKITITNLFSATPVRKKFLKSQRVEFSYILELITQYTLAYPEKRFSLTHNNKTIIDITKNADITTRIKTLLGIDIYDSLLPISYSDSYLTITGFITKPQAARSNSQKQYLFVNRRSVTNRLVSQAIKDTYSTLLDAQAYPVFIIFLTTPPDIIDINIHPRKEEIRFANTPMIYDAIQKATSESLSKNNLTFHNKNWKPEIISPRFGHTDSFAAEVLKDKSLPWESRNITKVTPSSDLQQIHNLYIITSTKYGMLLIDQHAAHERILYEEFSQEFKKQKHQPAYSLPKAVLFELSLADAELLLEHIPLFEKLGYEIEPFKDNIFFLNTLPVLFKDRDNLKIITEILADLAQEKNSQDIDKVSAKMIAYLACRSAVKAGNRLTKKQCAQIVEKLQKTPNNATCPHGRPTIVEIDLNRINKLFKRG